MLSQWDTISNMKKPEIRLNVRISVELKQAIRAQASKEGRTIAGLVLYVMREYLEAHQVRPQDKQEKGKK